ncbi:MAG TPA: hypothetical protein VGE35_01900 [Candidatus Paceibacterota bacterium]
MTTTSAPSSALEKATEALRQLISADRNFAVDLAAGIATRHARRHQVFPFTDSSLVYPLFVCMDSRTRGHGEPVLIAIHVSEVFLTDPRPDLISLGLFRRHGLGNPNDYILPGGGMAEIPMGVGAVESMDSQEGEGFLIAFRIDDFIRHTIKQRFAE